MSLVSCQLGPFQREFNDMPAVRFCIVGGLGVLAALLWSIAILIRVSRQL